MLNRTSFYAIAVVSLGASSPTLAQTPASSPMAAQPDLSNGPTSGSSTVQTQESEQQGGVPDIVVTAQRRFQQMQDVPIAITTLTAEELSTAGVARTDTLVQITPGLVMNRQLSGAVPYLRGVGNPSIQPGVESPVAIYVDGVYHAAAAGNIFSFNNVQQVEVLRGPQGTLFGRNATGGLINVTTRDPSTETAVEGTIGFGNYDTLHGTLYATGGSGQLAADIAVYGTDQMDGFGRNTVNGDEVNRNREIAVRSKLLWQPSSDHRVTLSGDWSRDRTDFGTVLGVYPGGVSIDRSTFAGNPYNSRTNWPDRAKIDNWGVSLKYQGDLGFATLTTTTAYRDVAFDLLLDQDGTPVPLVNVTVTDRFDSFQQEAILVGDGAKFDWTAGLFYFESFSGYVPLNVRSPIVPPLNFNTFTREWTTSYAGFAQGTYSVADNTRLTVGARYTVDRRRVIGQQLAEMGHPRPVGTVLASANARKKFPKLTYRFGIDHDITPDVLIYASIDRGFKSGLFATGSVSSTPVRPEILDAYQAGLKSDLVDRTLRLNLSAFYYDYKDIQLNRIENGAGILLNAAKGRSYGGELEVTYAPRLERGDLQLTGNLSLLDAKYTSFPNGPIFTVNPMGGNIQSAGDLSGNRMIRSPEWTLNIGASYSVPLGSGSLQLSGNYYHSASFFWEPDESVRQSAYDLINAQIAYAFGPDERFRVRAWGRNLTDQVYYIYAVANTLGRSGSAAQPRTYGLAFDFKF